jgi:DNA-binding PadR family transcriptional regulator
MRRTTGLEIPLLRYILSLSKTNQKEYFMFFGHHHRMRGMKMGFGQGLGRDPAFGGRGRDRQRRRIFVGTSLRLILLRLIEQQPRHGYELIGEIEELSGGAYAPSPGLLYPMLSMLSAMKLIEEIASEGSRKQFRITEAGSAHLVENQEAVEQAFEQLRALASDGESADHTPIARALENLNAVLRHRMSREGTSVSNIHDAAALIDEAAQKIERM